jgi:hypothetical protein
MVYSVELECLLTWFPNTPDSGLEEVMMSGATYRNSNTEFGGGIGRGTRTIYRIDFPGPLHVIGPTAFVEIGVENEIFKAQIQISGIGPGRKKSLTLKPGVITPFMINVVQPRGNQQIEGTAAVFQGVFTTDRGVSSIPFLEWAWKIIRP